MIIILRDSLYLSARLRWEHIPHLFPEWQAADVLEMVTEKKEHKWNTILL